MAMHSYLGLLMRSAIIIISVLTLGCQSGSQNEELAKIPPSPKAIQDKLSTGKLGPEMQVIPSGRSILGDATGVGQKNEQPTYEVVIKKPFALGKYEVTFDEYDYFCEVTGKTKPQDQGWGRGRRPVIEIAWAEAQAYVEWLSKQTGQHYFLPSEAQWEYAARAWTKTNYWWGDEPGDKNAQCGDCAEIHRCSDCKDVPLIDEGTVAVGSFKPNPFGLYDVHGNVMEWTADCGNDRNLPQTSKGFPRSTGDCSRHIMKDGSWWNNYRFIRASVRGYAVDGWDYKSKHVGFRVAREIKP